MTDDATVSATVASTPAAPTPGDLVGIMEQVFNSSVIPTPEEAEKIKTLAERITREGRGSTLDFSDPANSGMIAGIF